MYVIFETIGILLNNSPLYARLSVVNLQIRTNNELMPNKLTSGGSCYIEQVHRFNCSDEVICKLNYACVTLILNAMLIRRFVLNSFSCSLPNRY